MNHFPINATDPTMHSHLNQRINVSNVVHAHFCQIITQISPVYYVYMQIITLVNIPKSMQSILSILNCTYHRDDYINGG